MAVMPGNQFQEPQNHPAIQQQTHSRAAEIDQEMKDQGEEEVKSPVVVKRRRLKKNQ